MISTGFITKERKVKIKTNTVVPVQGRTPLPRPHIGCTLPPPPTQPVFCKFQPPSSAHSRTPSPAVSVQTLPHHLTLLAPSPSSPPTASRCLEASLTSGPLWLLPWPVFLSPLGLASASHCFLGHGGLPALAIPPRLCQLPLQTTLPR